MPAEPRSSPPDDAAIGVRLARLRTRVRAMLLGAAAARVLAVALAAIIGLALVDYVVRSPGWMRTVLLIAGLGALAWMVRRTLVPAWRFRPRLSDLALRVEGSDAGARAGLRDALASGLEFAERGEAPGESALTRALERASAERAARTVAAARLGEAVSWRHTARRAGWLAGAAAAAGLLALVAGPTLTGIALSRTLAPWAGASWPKRTEVLDATTLRVHPRGEAVPLRAALARADRARSQTRVEGVYRVITDGQAGPERRILLTGQGREVSVLDAAGAARTGELYERLIDPELPSGGPSGLPPKASVELEYWFRTRDDETPPLRIVLAEPPAVVEATATIAPPEYAAAASAAFASGPRDLGPGTDARAVVGPILAGSAVELRLTLNKPVPTPPAGDAAATHAFLAAALPGVALPAGTRASFDGRAWTLAFTPAESLRVGVRPVDEHGLAARDEAAFSFDVAADQPPRVTILDPAEDESVLPTASVRVVGEARDDVGIQSVWLTRQLATPPPGSAGAAPELTGEPTELTRRDATREQPIGPGASASVTLDLTPLGVRPGQEVWLHALARDAKPGRNGEPARSTPRRLRIIAEDELVGAIREELGAMRRAAMRLDADQAELQRTVGEGVVDAGDQQRQAQLTQRLAQQRELVERLRERTERNRLEDEALRGLLEDAAATLDAAVPPSQRAATGMDQAVRRAAPGEQAPSASAELSEQERREVAAEQDAVREELGRLADMLDRGEDTWLVGRALQRLLDRQRQLQEQTRRTGEETTGTRAEDLSPEQRRELEELAQRQEQLAEQARAALDQLAQRARQMQNADAAQAQGMRQAEQRGRERQLEQRMNEAARAARQNQTSTAEAQQQEAAEALEQMMQELQNARRNREVALRRILTDVLRALEELIAIQSRELEALAARGGGDLAGLDRAMIALQQRTLGVAEQARGDRATAGVASVLDRAAEAQGRAVAALRAPDEGEAEAQERESLRLLEQARDDARRMQEQAERNDRARQRAELRQKYRDALETQAAIAGETEPFIGKTIDRRDRVRVRALGERQEALRASLEEIRTGTEGLEDRAVFQLAHERLNEAAGLAAKKLRGGVADDATARAQASSMRLLRALVEALDNQGQDQDDLQDEEQGQAGGGGGSGGQTPPLVPPLAELRLLRHLQAEIAERTRGAEDARDADELRRLGVDQDALAERGRKLIEELESQEAPGVRPGEEAPGAPGEDPGEAPADRPEQPPAGGQP